jgi:glycosyltransferase involved in cell wall biosynthesis
LDRTEVHLVVWDEQLGQYRIPTDIEMNRLGVSPAKQVVIDDSGSLWESGGWLLVPDFVHETARRAAIRRANTEQGARVAYLVHDCVPLSAAETSIPEMTPAFADYLTDVAASDLALTVSKASAHELTNCLRVVSNGNGGELPIVPVPLAEEGLTSVSHLDAIKDSASDGLIKVLCVGSSEPRKNHGALLYACEVLWQEGLRFHLDLVATRSWANEDELDLFERLRVKGRPIEWHSEVTDEGLRRLYESCDIFVFPSVHEGFGLPVIEALQAGLPVITGEFGATGDSGQLGGCILIDPRDDTALLQALRELVTKQDLREQLGAEALSRPIRTWLDFSNEVKAALP